MLREGLIPGLSVDSFSSLGHINSLPQFPTSEEVMAQHWQLLNPKYYWSEQWMEATQEVLYYPTKHPADEIIPLLGQDEPTKSQFSSNFSWIKEGGTLPRLLLQWALELVWKRKERNRNGPFPGWFIPFQHRADKLLLFLHIKGAIRTLTEQDFKCACPLTEMNFILTENPYKL